ncbi:hypothetical protein C8J57DRAFT_1588366 [Mycena rebaudengoi]|nr:hypothetical protein C8J57DRAFT_1588366 [Mycena rebaudengoi]
MNALAAPLAARADEILNFTHYFHSVGPIFIANILNWLFMGTLVMQVYGYYQNFPKDRLAIKLLVYTLFILDVAQTGLTTHHGWWFIVTIWGNPHIFDFIIWSAGMIPFFFAGVVQIFYAWRIWTLSANKFMRGMAILIVLIALLQSFTAMVTGIVILQNPVQSNLIRLHPQFSIWLTGSLVADVLITACMLYVLNQAKNRTNWSASETMLSKLINQVVQSGSVTVICAAVDLGFFVGQPTTNSHFVPAYMLGKLYTNTLMLTLNLRRPNTNNNGTDSVAMNSVGKSGPTSGRSQGVHVERSTFRTGDMNTVTTMTDSKWMPEEQEHRVNIRKEQAYV